MKTFGKTHRFDWQKACLAITGALCLAWGLDFFLSGEFGHYNVNVFERTVGLFCFLCSFFCYCLFRLFSDLGTLLNERLFADLDSAELHTKRIQELEAAAERKGFVWKSLSEDLSAIEARLTRVEARMPRLPG